jgi:hypothetical protein
MNSMSPSSSLMSLAQMQLTDALGVDKTAMQMAAQKTRSAWEGWKLFQDLHTEIYKIHQEATLHRAKIQDKMADKWGDFVRG